MAGRIPDETLQVIRDRVSLVEVVSSYVQLRRAGRNFVGCCPFHQEKTPSFTVNEERGFFHCFGCGVGGNVFHFLMRVDGLDFVSAVEQLATRAGVKLELEKGSQSEGVTARLYELNQEVADLFVSCLRGSAGQSARQYLAQRDLGEKTAAEYGVGYAPPGGSFLVRWLQQKRIPVELAVSAGLLGTRTEGGAFDRFRDRVMFPIRDRRDRVVGFGGRTLGDQQPKYLNSPETPVFRKGEGLYGLREARPAVRASGRIVLVEGYMDVLMLAQGEIRWATATLGTALTVSQLKLVTSLGGGQVEVFFLFDGDEAGRKAATRAFSVSAEAGVWGRVAFLPEGHDPDSYVRRYGKDATLELLDRARSLPDFFLDRMAPPGCSLAQRARAAEETAAILAKVRSEAHFEVLAARAASRLGVGEDLFRRMRNGVADRPQALPPAPPEPQAKRPAAEILLVEAMVAHPAAIDLVADRGVIGRFLDPGLGGLARSLVEAHRSGTGVGSVLQDVEEPLAGRLRASLLGHGPVGESDPWAMAQDCIDRIEAQFARAQRQAMAAELRRAENMGDADGSRHRLEALNELLRRSGSPTG